MSMFRVYTAPATLQGIYKKDDFLWSTAGSGESVICRRDRPFTRPSCHLSAYALQKVLRFVAAKIPLHYVKVLKPHIRVMGFPSTMIISDEGIVSNDARLTLG